MLISVRDYRGVERADVELAPLALVAGMNEQGKSCLAEAARAVLAGVPIPVPGVAKKDAKLLVRDGAESGHVEVSDEGGGWKLHWPRCDFTTGRDGTVPCATEFAVGLGNLLDLNERERPKALARYIDGEPKKEDLARAMADAGFDEDAIDEAWELVAGPLGWDGAYKRIRELAARLKGQWEGVTNERYGARKAADWQPDGIDETPIEALEQAIAQRKAEHEAVVARVAVDEALLAGLRERALKLQEIEEQEEKARTERDRLRNEYNKLCGKVRPKVPERPMACPKCEAPLTVVDGALIEVEKPPTKAAITKAQKALKAHEESLQKAVNAYSAADDEYMRVRELVKAARMAAEEIAKVEGRQSGEPATEADVAAARILVREAEGRLQLRKAWERAHALHRDIARAEILAEILAPEGLRRRRLAEGLKAFNQRLLRLCSAAGWPVVRLDENLKAHYGTRPVWAASKSGQWRARVVLQLAMAQIDGSAAVVIDEADILDHRGRNELFALLSAAKIPALACMTMNKRTLVPDLEAVGMGRSYWIEGGIAEPIAKARERAA